MTGWRTALSLSSCASLLDVTLHLALYIASEQKCGAWFTSLALAEILRTAPRSLRCVRVVIDAKRGLPHMFGERSIAWAELDNALGTLPYVTNVQVLVRVKENRIPEDDQMYERVLGWLPIITRSEKRVEVEIQECVSQLPDDHCV